jgi:hypothetical protein
MTGWKQQDDGSCTYHGKSLPCPASLSQAAGAADDDSQLPAARLAPKLVPRTAEAEEEEEQQHGQSVDAAASKRASYDE